jgi:signal transduction histidine kinase
MPHGGRLQVSVTGDSTVANIEVADTGPGLPVDQLERIFDRFVRSSDSRGTGLGLSISRDLVEAHHGMVTAANRAAGGAVVTVTLPIRR